MFSRTNGSSPQIDWLELFGTLTNFILFNMLWLLGSLFIVTIPAMTAALFASVAPWGRRQSLDAPLSIFWTAVWRYWLKASVVGVVDLVLGSLVGLNLYVIWQMGFEQFIALPAFIITSLLGVFLILANVYIWPLLVTLDPPLRGLFKNGLRLTVVHPFWGLLIAVVALIPVGIGLFLPRLFFVTVAFAAAALITYAGAWRIILRYLDEDERKALGVE